MRMTPQYQTILLNQVWESSEEFLADYADYGIPTTISNTNATTLYYLLFARYGNNPIANWDPHVWKLKVFSKIYMYGPTWEKRLDIQSKVRNLTDTELVEGSKATHNTALNPQTAPGTGTDTELDYINQQDVSKYRKSKMEGYELQWSLLATDVTEEFIARFSDLFLKVVAPQDPVKYITEDDEYEL